MQREGADLHNMQVSDFLCDFCARAWDGAFPMVEGHQGSLICGSCLSVAYTQVVLGNQGDAPEGATCSMCLEERDEAMWSSPVRDAYACRRCLRQAGTRLDRDEDWDWKKPGREGEGE